MLLVGYLYNTVSPPHSTTAYRIFFIIFFKVFNNMYFYIPFYIFELPVYPAITGVYPYFHIHFRFFIILIRIGIYRRCRILSISLFWCEKRWSAIGHCTLFLLISQDVKSTVANIRHCPFLKKVSAIYVIA